MTLKLDLSQSRTVTSNSEFDITVGIDDLCILCLVGMVWFTGLF